MAAENESAYELSADGMGVTLAAPCAFGAEMRERHFSYMTPERGLRLNNGSFGAAPTCVLEARQRLIDEWTHYPDQFWKKLPEYMARSIKAVAEVVKAREEDVVIIDNLTVAANIVAMSLLSSPCKETEVVLLNSHTYNAVKETFRSVGDHTSNRVELERVELPFPLEGANAIVAAYKAHLTDLAARRRGCRLALAVVDHVSSNPAMIMPVKEIVALCKQAGFETVMVDGAHAPGHIVGLDVPSIGADVYGANIHKWLFGANSCAFLWANPEARAKLHHPMVSHAYKQGLAAECAMVGTRDYSAMLAVPASVSFWNQIGGDEVAKRNHELAVEAANMLAAAWGTALGTPPDMAGSTIMVGLPTGAGSTVEDSGRIKHALWDKYRITTQYSFPAEGRLWLRLSAAVYNHLADFEPLRDAILELC